MSTVDLSIIIPSRCEMFLKKTVEDILEHREGNTEVIAVLDGALADPPIEIHPDVTVIYHGESIGQRAASNEAARLAKGKYIMKCDAHCAFDQGFDVKMLEAIKGHDDWTMVPIMRNLHAFDWVCPDGHRRYQGPSGPCKECGKPTERDVCWIAKTSPQSKSYCFDSEPHFQYFGGFSKRPEGQGDITPTMSLQGSCFMLTKERYFALDICSEEFGSWGSQGIEVALKSRLSGGEVMVNHNTWYAHLFRTQGGDFSFPYPQSGNQVSRAKRLAKEVFFNNNWEQAIYPISFVIDEFTPVPGWTNKEVSDLKRIELDTERSGIYMITSRNNARVYIGSAVNIRNRIFEHKKSLKDNSHANVHLQNSYNKHGEDDLEFCILYFCPSSELIEKEQEFIEECKNEIGWKNMFNICPTAGSTLGKSCSDETKEKISKSKMGNKVWNKGLTKDTDNRIKKYGDKQLGVKKWKDKEHPKGMLGKKHSEESRRKISRALKGRVFSEEERKKNSDGVKAFWARKRQKEQPVKVEKPKKQTKGIIYYSHCCKSQPWFDFVRKQIAKGMKEKHIVSVTDEPIDFGKNIVKKPAEGWIDIFERILTGLEASTADVIFFCEHDVYYAPECFDFMPPDKDKIYYNKNVWHVRASDGFSIYYEAKRLSQLCAYRDVLIRHYRKRLELVKKNGFSFAMGFEPGSHNRAERVDDVKSGYWESSRPSIDIKYGGNSTKARWSQAQFRSQSSCLGWKEADYGSIPGWTKEELEFIISI